MSDEHEHKKKKTLQQKENARPEKQENIAQHWSHGSWFIALLGIVTFSVAVIIIFAVGIYALGWHGYPTQVMSSIIPYPAAIVRGNIIRVSDLLAETEGFVAYQDANPELVQTALSRDEIAENVAQRYVQLAILEDVAEKNEISVSNQEVDEEFASAKENRMFSELEEMLKTFRWSEDDLKERVIRAYLLRQRIEDRIGRETLLEELENAQSVIYLLKI